MTDTHFNIVDLFFASAKKYPKKTAIVYKKEEISFSELEKQINDTANYFISKGIEKGDRVLIFVPMSLDLYRSVLALFKIGAVAVFLDEWVSIKRLELCCEVAQCKAFIGIFKARVLAMFSGELRKIPIKLGASYTRIENNYPVTSTTKNDTALITFTTGSTGTPKAAKRTHGFLHEQFTALIEKIEPNENDVDMPVLPIVLLINLGAGNTSVIADFKASKPDSLDPEKVYQQLLTNKVNRIVSSPFFLKKLCEYILLNNLSLPDLKKAFTGGAPVFPNEAMIYTKALPQCNIQIVYGSTEAEPISAISAKELIKETKHSGMKGLRVGNLHRTTQAKIIRITEDLIACGSDDELNNYQLPKPQVGEIIVSGPHVLSEYFNNETALKRNKIFIGDKVWHRTGDSGFFDEHDVLFLTGRCSSVFKIGERLITPFIYENILQQIAAMGTVLSIEGKAVIVVELKNKSEQSKVKEKIKNTSLYFDDIIFTKKLPRDPRHNSKIDYEKLKTILKNSKG